MHALRTRNWAKRALAALLLCSLLFQIQTVFACEMMDHRGPIEHCCCDDMANGKSTGEALDEHSVCCEINTELTVKTVDENKKKPVLVSSQPGLDPLPATLTFMLVMLWPELAPLNSSPVTWDLATNPADPGTQTYLSTLRLRI